ncbi:hypothetical protein V6617_10125 [Pelagibacterium nitratireducens]|uniref:Uncharacterized protein n=1 Tax=Pelagibacterium nitratireducens TaxID=1046114 RepID=A0ABZ2HUU5_9HYPH
MSLVRLAARISAVHALKGRLFEGTEVLDSEIGAIGLGPDGSLVAESESRFVAVYTNDGQALIREYEPRALHTGGTCEITFEMGITAAMLVRDPETERQQVMAGVPGTDAAFEFYLDMVGRQIMDALSDPANDWADIWRALCPVVVKIDRVRTDDAQQVRLAGHQIKMTCQIVDDPVRGTELEDGGAFSRFLLALDALGSSEADAQASLIRSALGTGAGLQSVKRSRTLGLADAESVALSGIEQLDEGGDPVESGTLVVEVDGIGTSEAK